MTDDLPTLARLALEFFREADNRDDPSAFDLDPRPGHVRLGHTVVRGGLSEFAVSLRGMMNPEGDLHAVLQLGSNIRILSVCDFGRSISCCDDKRCETFSSARLLSPTA